MRSLGQFTREGQIACAYFVLAVLSIMTTRYDSGMALVWLPTSMLIAVLKRRPRRSWSPMVIGCGAASMTATALVGVGPAAALPLALANMAEACVAAFVMRRLQSSRRPLGSMGWTVRLAVAAGLVGPLAMAAIAAPAMHVLFGANALSTIERVMIGHGLSNIVGVPIFALYHAGVRDRRSSAMAGIKWAELASLFAIQVVVDGAVFLQSTIPLLFLAVLPTVVIAYRAASRAAAASLILLILISGAATINGLGPIHLLDAPLSQRLHLLCIYLVSIVLTVMPIAAGLRSRSHLVRRLSESEQRYRMLADHSGDVIMHTDVRGLVKFVSPSIERVGGYSPVDLLGTNCMAIIHPSSHAVVEAHYQLALGGDLATRFEYRARCKNGTWRWFESDCRGATDPAGQRGVVSIVRDISERKEREEQLATAALTDSLTGLPNRRAFREAANRILNDQRVRPAALAILDIDHFKAINDSFGHDAGDEVLQSFAALAQRLRRKEDLMARIGGEEFAILLPDTSLSAALTVCDRLRAEVADTLCVTASGPVRITISGGVAMLTSDGLDRSLRRADEALYRAKREGRDRLLEAEAA
jgi:diguanylate cyclase (GGDEF)-like protein/PAS domain S-box-containing protein